MRRGGEGCEVKKGARGKIEQRGQGRGAGARPGAGAAVAVRWPGCAAWLAGRDALIPPGDSAAPCEVTAQCR